MDQDCTSKCVAYIDVSELSDMAESLGLTDMHCIRVIMELSRMMTAMADRGFEDVDDDDDDF